MRDKNHDDTITSVLPSACMYR